MTETEQEKRCPVCNKTKSEAIATPIDDILFWRPCRKCQDGRHDFETTKSEPCSGCGKLCESFYWENIAKGFCSLECTNEYLTAEGFTPISAPDQSAKLQEPMP
jgi:hypothetical protein